MTAQVLSDDPDYARTSGLDELRRTEYGYLDEQEHVYLDYAGAGLAARSQYRAHQRRLAGNPLAGNPSSDAATQLVEWTRARVLRHLNADPAEYVAIFTPNATGAARLVGETYPFSRRSRLVLTFDNHDAVTGLREFARATTCVPTTAPDLRVDPDLLATELTRGHRGLFAYPAQSDFSGVRHPLDWIDLAKGLGYDVLLDAAAYLPTARLDLAAVHPDFVIVSWYKIFGYPTGVGCLVARRAALPDAVKDDTLNYPSIPDVYFGLDWLDQVDVELVATRVRCLTAWFLNRLTSLRHSDGGPMTEVYGPLDTHDRGGTVAFNLLDRDGRIVNERVVATETSAARISLHVGRFRGPGAGDNASGLRRDRFRALRYTRTNTPAENLDALGQPPATAIRVSFGLASTVDDVERFIDFARGTYRDRVVETAGLPPRDHCERG
jgi:selenocysteine lyase/cysteine desulfurase